MGISALIKENIKIAAKRVYGVTLADVHLEHPENSQWGDFATNVAMALSGGLQQPPLETAKKLSYELQKMDFSFDRDGVRCEALISLDVAPPGFINFKLSNKWLVNELYEIVGNDSNYGSADLGEGKRLALEHSNVNPNKAAHVGHLRNACLGQFVEHAYEFLGYDVEVQYLDNDLGMQTVTSLMGVEEITDISPHDYQKFDHYMWDVYSQMEARIAEDPDLQERRQKMLLEAEDASSKTAGKLVDLSRKVLHDQLITFQALGFDYDVIIHESDVSRLDLWGKTFEILKQNDNIYCATEGKSKGCWLVKMESSGASQVENSDEIEGDKIIVRSNGVPTYTGRDIAYHMWKFGLLDSDFHYKKWDIGTQEKPLWSTTSQLATGPAAKKISFSGADMVLNVIDVKQTYALEAVKSSLRYLGYDTQASNMTHINYGFVYLSSGTAKLLGIDVSDGKKQYAMSGRKGWGIKIDDFTDMVGKKLVEGYGESRTLKQVRNGAIKFELLKYDTFQDIIFDLDEALSIKGFSGPYLQYTFARASAILEKSGLSREDILSQKPGVDGQTVEETAVLRLLYKFPEVVQLSAERYSPGILCRYLFDIAQKFNTFYTNVPVLSAPRADDKHLRLLLVAGTAIVLKNGLFLLGIEAPSKM